VTAPPAVLPHRNAILAALAGAGLAVGEGVAPATVPTTGMYVVLYMDPGRAVSESLADQRTDLSTTFQVTCVAPTVEKVLWLADRVRGALFAAPAVDGRSAWRPEELGGPPVQRDDGVTPPLFYLPVQYRLYSTAA
jgi:hypothetical protein